MKKLLFTLLLLWTCYTPAATAQTLTFAQIIHLEELEQMQQDIYLTQRGWKFVGTRQINDSVNAIFWHFYSTKGQNISQLEVHQEIGAHKVIIYSTALKQSFDAIRTAVLNASMEVMGVNNSGAMRTFYRGRRYNTTLIIEPPHMKMPYNVDVQQHGLVKMVLHLNGEAEPRVSWVRPEFYQHVQEILKAKQRESASSDSIEVK